MFDPAHASRLPRDLKFACTGGVTVEDMFSIVVECERPIVPGVPFVCTITALVPGCSHRLPHEGEAFKLYGGATEVARGTVVFDGRTLR